MTRAHRISNLIAVVVPFLAFLAAVVLLWHRAIGPMELILLVVLYYATGFGVTVGYHRLFTHRGFETSRFMRAFLAILGSLAIEGSVIRWVADHRKHHAFTDVEGDPHSPHVDHHGGVLGPIKGLFHAHVGWLFHSVGQADEQRFAPDLVKDPTLRAIDKLFPLWIVISLGLPFGIGYAVGGDIGTALTALLWGGAVRVFMLHHVTWSINSVCHFFGRRRFDIDDESRNVGWLSILSFGESWHHNHHAFPTSAFHGLKPAEAALDPSGWIIRAMEKLGLVWNVVRVSPEKQAAKAIPPAPAPGTSDASTATA
jgi:stearoyl-CoA desaturase (delta-9 desaturase)